MPRPYSKKLYWRIITHYDYTHSSFRFQYRLLTMTTFFEIAVYTKRSMYAGTHFTDPRRMESCVNFSGKEGHPNIQPSTRLVIEPGISGQGGRDLTIAPTSPLYLRE